MEVRDGETLGAKIGYMREGKEGGRESFSGRGEVLMKKREGGCIQYRLKGEEKEDEYKEEGDQEK